ncbi:ADP-ribose pyrophosphatase YjhB, NUDIX family [Nocardia amikacinitolerans]|uniref:NUDIX hydrolase n=1 Tax=Nocardia amikacinitolerans TaxID=756689 RepID=UPI0008318B31|nr:NUDIX domain-containing protein [Nocardia amikacinitolerans]MCP2318308.1 ADP-ribose pyrophosphatase YjhB, NUDIX family [Nocardia amikacinitolerans]
MNAATAAVAEIVRGIDPCDELEREHIATALDWLASTDDVFRREKPAVPPRHLVAYTVLVDPVSRAVFLGRHRLAGLWLPMGGHLDPGEHPFDAARREAGEELGIAADFDVVGSAPLFLTVTTTVGIGGGHEDVSLWYVIRGDRTREYRLDPREFDGGRWWDIDRFAVPESDPYFARFLSKLDAVLGTGLDPVAA